MGQVLRIGVLLAAIGAAGQATANQILWQPDLQTALNQAAVSKRPVLVHFWSPSCAPCMRLEAEVFSRPETCAALNNNFVCVRVNCEETPAVAKQYNVNIMPTDVL